MTHAHDADAPVMGPARPPVRRRRLTAWPLWATLAGVAGTIATIVTDLRPPAETEAWRAGEDYTVTATDVWTLEPLLGRVGHLVGLVTIAALLVFVAVWRTHVEARFPESAAARVVGLGLIATAAAQLFGFGWRGALANYLGPEKGLYDTDGLFVYYMLTDFGAYLPWFGGLVSLLAIAWMAWREGLVSRGLGSVVGVIGVGFLVGIVLSGVPGLPGVAIPPAIAVVGLWLALGRSAITTPEVPR